MKTIPVRHITSSVLQEHNPGRFSIRNLQQVLSGSDMVHHLHKHDFYFVLSVQEGNGIHEIDFVKHEVQDNSVFILRPGQVHSLELNAGCKGFLMEFDLSFYHPKSTITDQRWRKATSRNVCEVQAARFGKVSSILSNLLHEFNNKQEGYLEAIKANLDLFFIEYVRQSANPKSIAENDNGYTQERFEAFTGLLEANICKMKSASQYADLLNMSSYQLNSITKVSVGKTVSDLINEHIILEAKRHLLATPNQVKEIADHLGYEDISYFIRFFRKHTGHSPESFRKNFK
jgi:AraC-like DNA-binding protein/mannose-6-phosphate isomerase-like protein (cupin superfamily)